MTTQDSKTTIEFTDNELLILLTLLDSTIGGPTWRRNEEEGRELIRKIEDCAEL